MINEKIQFLMWLLVAGCFALLLFSMLIPKKTYHPFPFHIINDESIETKKLALTTEAVVTYHMSTQLGKSLWALQPRISKQGQIIQSGSLVCRIYTKKQYNQKEKSKSETRIPLHSLLDEQYVLFKVKEYAQFKGDLVIELFYDSEGEAQSNYPAIICSEKEQNTTTTYYNNQKQMETIQTYHVYTGKHYPLVYDAQIALLIMLAVTMTVTGGKKCEKNSNEKLNQKMV